MFTSKNRKTTEFLRMAQLLGFLETSNNKVDKTFEIKMAMADGLINEDEALELAIEFC